MSHMVRTQIYIPKKLKGEVKKMLGETGSNFSDFVRMAIAERLHTLRYEKKSGMRTLYEMALRAEAEGVSGPPDLAVNHDYYLYGEGRI